MGLEPRSASGIITNFLGVKAGSGDANSALDAFRADLPKMSPKMAESLDPAAVVSWFWSDYPYTLGSYASAKVGQYTTMLEVASEPALRGRLQWRRRKRKPCRRGADRGHGAAKKMSVSRARFLAV